MHGDSGDLDPLVRLAVAHYQFEAIHPFTDGNGRTGRVLNSLLLVEQGLLPIPILYLSRYLHLVIDLALDAPADFDVPIVVDEPGFRFGDYRNRFDDDVEDELDPIRFRIQENRIVKNGELRYFDHPKFGVLAKITRVEEEEEDLETDGLPEPLLSSRQ